MCVGIAAASALVAESLERGFESFAPGHLTHSRNIRSGRAALCMRVGVMTLRINEVDDRLSRTQ